MNMGIRKSEFTVILSRTHLCQTCVQHLTLNLRTLIGVLDPKYATGNMTSHYMYLEVDIVIHKVVLKCSHK